MRPLFGGLFHVRQSANMKLQYLGDSRDSFKWDYHDFLVTQLGNPILNIVLMMTPNDKSNDGKSHPKLFPARNEVIEFCEGLRTEMTIESIKSLPTKTKASYKINLHKNGSYFTDSNRKDYFSGVSKEEDQLLFLDPDNGFEPEESCNEKHVKYSDIAYLLEQISDHTVISVFQYFRRKSFVDDFTRIQERLHSGIATAIYWHSLMFVAISNSESVIGNVVDTNRRYAKDNPVKVIA